MTTRAAREPGAVARARLPATQLRGTLAMLNGVTRRSEAGAVQFADRNAAGRELAHKVAGAGLVDPVVLALPRGGVPVALPVARALGCPLDLLLVRKIGAPGRPELAIAAVVDGEPPQLVVNPQAEGWLSGLDAYLADAEAAARAEIARRRTCYLAGRRPVSVTGRAAVLVDDGIATGTTMRAALAAMRAQGAARTIVAVPVAPSDTVAELKAAADDVLCLATPRPFLAVGAHFEDFHQIDDAELVALLRAAPPGNLDDEAGPPPRPG